jgi:hypothetical protein
MTDRQLELGAGEELGAELDVVDALVVEEGEPSFPPTAVAAAAWDVLGERNLFGEADESRPGPRRRGLGGNTRRSTARSHTGGASSLTALPSSGTLTPT